MGLPLMAFNPDGEPIDVVNHYVNFGWEYVLHCHILSHEEMDMMRTQAVAVNPDAPDGHRCRPVRHREESQQYLVSWTDTSKNETAFVIERRIAGSTDPFTQVAMVQTENRVNMAPLAHATDADHGRGHRPCHVRRRSSATRRTVYEYNVYAINTVGDTWDYSNPAFNNLPPGGGFPTITVDSRDHRARQSATPSRPRPTSPGR